MPTPCNDAMTVGKLNIFHRNVCNVKLRQMKERNRAKWRIFIIIFCRLDKVKMWCRHSSRQRFLRIGRNQVGRWQVNSWWCKDTECLGWNHRHEKNESPCLQNGADWCWWFGLSKNRRSLCSPHRVLERMKQKLPCLYGLHGLQWCRWWFGRSLRIEVRTSAHQTVSFIGADFAD